MAEENIEWNINPVVMNETVLAVKRFLDAELAKCDELKCLYKNIQTLFTGKKGGFKHAKKFGVGPSTILKFLGKNWKFWMIQEALDTLKDKSIDREAVESLPTTAHARKFKKAVKDYKVPRAKQKEIASCTLYPCRSKIAAQDKSSARQKASEGCPVIGTG